MKTLVKTKVINLTETQFSTLKKMKSYNVDVGRDKHEILILKKC